MRILSRAPSAALTFAFVAGPGALLAQRVASDQPATTQLLFLGTAAGPPLRANRSEPATLLIVDGRRYLIDCGIGTARRLIKAGIPSETIGTIFFTHLHADHTVGLVDVLANDFQQKDAADAAHRVDIYGPPQTKELVDAAYRFISIPYGVFAAEGAGPRGGVPAASPFAVHEIGQGVVYQDDKIKVVAVENTHYAMMSPSARAIMKSYSYRFETPHGTIVFTGDTGPNDAVARLARGAEVLVSEVEDAAAIREFVDSMAQRNHWPAARRDNFEAHMTKEHLDISDVGRMATSAGVKAVLLYHWDPSDPAAYLTGMAKYFSGPVFGTEDLQRYCLDGSSSSRESGRSQLHRCD